MTLRILCLAVFLISFAGRSGTALGAVVQSQTDPAQEQSAQGSEEKPGETPKEEKKFQLSTEWLNSGDNLRGLRYSGQRLQRLQSVPRDLELDPQSYVEEETLQLTPEKTKTVRRLYSGSRLIRVTEEIRTVQEDGQEDAVRTMSTRDANGRLQVQMEETQRVVVRGEDEFEIQTVVRMPGPSRRLEPVEQFVQTEKRLAGGAVELDRIHYVLGGNREWQARERRMSVTETRGDQSLTEEEVFRADLNQRLSLSDRISSREWEAGDGTVRRTIETRSLNPQGKMELTERVSTVQETGPGGQMEIVQDLEVRQQGSGKLELQERVVASSTGTETGQGSTEFRVEAPDGSGRLAVIRTYREEKSGDPDGERTTRSVRPQ